MPNLMLSLKQLSDEATTIYQLSEGRGTKNKIIEIHFAVFNQLLLLLFAGELYTWNLCLE
jgi:hypothetical protein